MVTKPISSSSMYYQRHIFKKNNFNNENSQRINLQANSTISLGTINGKEFDMKINPTGGYQWTGAIPIKITNSSVFTANDIAAMYAAQQYTQEEYNECARVTGVINQLYLTVDRGWTAERFNEFCEQIKISKSDVESALNRLGFYYNQPFSINGRTFTYESGILKEFKE